jgi:hypothetical protein
MAIQTAEKLLPTGWRLGETTHSDKTAIPVSRDWGRLLIGNTTERAVQTPERFASTPITTIIGSDLSPRSSNRKLKERRIETVAPKYQQQRSLSRIIHNLPGSSISGSSLIAFPSDSASNTLPKLDRDIEPEKPVVTSLRQLTPTRERVGQLASRAAASQKFQQRTNTSLVNGRVPPLSPCQKTGRTTEESREEKTVGDNFTDEALETSNEITEIAKSLVTRQENTQHPGEAQPPRRTVSRGSTQHKTSDNQDEDVTEDRSNKQAGYAGYDIQGRELVMIGLHYVGELLGLYWTFIAPCFDSTSLIWGRYLAQQTTWGDLVI